MNSGSYKADIATGAALGGLVLPVADVLGIFLMGGLLTVGSCAVLLGWRLLVRVIRAATPAHHPTISST
ncbi:hypothetical protein [Streptomyces sp. TRM72054]|uniref:hypothetical protein n=1 Tax=Streptomyces sp. TRM72054 TaxID=2870562 RepID=UPI0027E03851|nr:hypothetical protein [Streptomyces sp. TRM72054]